MNLGIKSFLEIYMNPQICENSELGGNNVVLTLEIFFSPMLDEGADKDSILFLNYGDWLRLLDAI